MLAVGKQSILKQKMLAMGKHSSFFIDPDKVFKHLFLINVLYFSPSIFDTVFDCRPYNGVDKSTLKRRSP